MTEKILSAGGTPECPKYLAGAAIHALAPCGKACPAGNDIATLIKLCESGDFERAARFLWQTNPIPAIIGRVCSHPCENPCNRKYAGGAVSVACVERFIGDWADEHNLTPQPPEFNGKKIAVVGSGPEGLSAAFYLRMLGYEVNVLESQEYPGGLLRLGIPEFRLPYAVIEKEFRKFTRMDIKFTTDMKVTNPPGLLKDHQAVIFAAGRTVERRLGVPGEDLEGLYSAAALLKNARMLYPLPSGTQALIIGGGNTALDCARTLARLGKKVTVLYRRSQAEMSCFAEDFAEALEEGVQFEFRCAPQKIERENNRLKVEFFRTKQGHFDPAAKKFPVKKIQDSEFTLECDFAVKAAGNSVDLSWLPDGMECAGFRLPVSEHFETPVKKVFACGYCTGGCGSVPAAIASGRNCAYSVNALLSGKELPAPDPAEKRGTLPGNIVKFKDLNPACFKMEPRLGEEKASAGERIRDFRQVRAGLRQEEAVHECARCFKCGL